MLISHTHHLLFPLGAAHTRDLLVKELDGVVHTCRQGAALIQEAKTRTPCICATLHNLKNKLLKKKTENREMNKTKKSKRNGTRKGLGELGVGS